MARLTPKRETLSALFAKSGNVCAFPGCNEEIISCRNQLVGQICHIEAANPGAPRYNPNSSDEQRRAFENLMLMCYRHHRETDDAATYDVHSLKTMKLEHEARHGQKPFKVNEAFLHRLMAEMEDYWAAIDDANRNSHIVPNLAVPVSTGAHASDQFAEVYKSLERLSQRLEDLSAMDHTLNDEIRSHLASLGYDLAPYDLVPCSANPFLHRNREVHALAIPNARIDLVVAIKQTEVRFLEEYAKTHSNEAAALDKLKSAKDELNKIAVSMGYAD